ncbi:LacI family transcriptional regulator [Skermanella aerolata]|uniref:LacI family DNA-binding transcriptional regulator n=1 Tax=Skermanella aerolata TaxID=393310 RepID=UPI003D20F726
MNVAPRPIRTPHPDPGGPEVPANVTIKQIAREAGVGIATVSRVMHNHHSVSEDLRQRVRKAIDRLGYEPNPAAQAMRTRSSRTIACAIRDISIPEFASFVWSAERIIRDAGYTLILTNTGDDPRHEADLLKVFAKRRIDGLLLTKSAEAVPELEDAIARVNAPVVLIDREAGNLADSVVIDHRRGIRAAVDHLASFGHTRIALLTGKPHMRPSRERIEGYREGLAANGIPFDERMLQAESFVAEQCFRTTSFMLDGTDRPTAIIAGGMSLLVGVLKAVSLRGLRIPDDLSIVAGCDSDLALLTSPPTTAIRWDIQAWGKASAELLLDRIGGRHSGPGRQMMLPTELVIRGSCGRPPERRSDRP